MKPESARHLLLARQVFTDGESIARKRDSTSTLRALIQIDLAIETALNAVVLEFAAEGGAARGDTKFKELWQSAHTALKQATGATLRQELAIRHLHEARNLAQHAGLLPAQSDMPRHLHCAKTFLDAVFQDGFDQKFESFRVWSLIPSEILRAHVEVCDAALANGEFEKCLTYAIIVHHLLWREVAELLSAQERDYWNSHNDLNQFFSWGGGAEEMQQLYRAYQSTQRRIDHLWRSSLRLESELIWLSSGIPVRNVRRFASLAESTWVNVFEDGTVVLFKGGRILENEEDARFAVDHITAIVLALCEVHPEVLAMNIPTLKIDIKG